MNGSLPLLLTQLVDRLSSKEDLELEFKSAQGGLPKSMWSTVSAFANTRGGWIILGVEEDENESAVIVGVKRPWQILKELNDQLRNAQKINHSVCSTDDISVQALGDMELIVMRVPAAARKLRPIYITGNPYTGTYVRRHEGDYQCSKPEVDRMMREASEVAADSTVLPRFTLEDLDPLSLAQYRQIHQNRNPASPRNGYDNQAFLQSIGGWRRDRERGLEGITVAGLLLLGKAEALHEWRTRHLIDFRILDDSSQVTDRWIDRVVSEGNLLNTFDSVYPRLTSNLPVPFRLQDGIRASGSQVHVVLREALVNLLVHADYAEPQVSLIMRSDSDFSFRNPGSSRVLESDMILGNRSDPRNPELVRMFRYIGLAEEAGTGIPKIMQTWRDLGFKSPRIVSETERYEFELNLRAAHLLSDKDRVWLASLREHWSEPEQLALTIARHDGDIDNVRLRAVTGDHPADTTKVLGGLRDRGFLTMIGGGRSASYRLAGEAADALPMTGVTIEDSSPYAQPSSGDVKLNSGDVQPSSADTQPSSADTQPSSADAQRNSADVKPSSGDDAFISQYVSRLSKEKQRQLVEVAKTIMGKRNATRSMRDEVIVRICSIAPLSTYEISSFIKGNSAYTRIVLKRLMATGKLRYVHPDRPNHPQQRYIAAENGAVDEGRV